MLELLKKNANRTLTENGAVTLRGTGSDCLDLFAAIGAIRRESEADIVARFDSAWANDADTALKILFYARDIRGGLGERRVFRTIFRHMAFDRTCTVEKNLWAVGEFGRYDDLLGLLDTPVKQAVLTYIEKRYEADMRAWTEGKDVSLLGKWLPSVNAHNRNAVRYGKMIARALGLSEAEYRKGLSKLRARIAIIENNLRERDYSFDYAKQPSQAMLKYRQAFFRNDGDRYRDFLDKVACSEAVLNTGTLFPYEIIRPISSEGIYHPYTAITDDERKSIDVTWNAQLDFTDGENVLVVVDGSGSMYGPQDPRPIDVAVSLGIYFAERNRGEFRNHFITFSENPRLVEIEGRDIYEKVHDVLAFNEIANTDIRKVFELILDTAVKHGVSGDEMPATIYIISDMEFDNCVVGADITNFDYAKNLFAMHGYTLPTLVFWNVASRNRQQPVEKDESGVILVSGASPQVFSMVSSGDVSPYAFMMDTLGNERYAKLKV